MSGEIIIDTSTTVEQLHAEVYDSNLDTYASVYADLLEQFLDFENLIRLALEFSASFEIQQSGFIDFINGDIARIYSEIAQNGYPAEIDIDDDEVDPIFRDVL